MCKTRQYQSRKSACLRAHPLHGVVVGSSCGARLLLLFRHPLRSATGHALSSNTLDNIDRMRIDMLLTDRTYQSAHI
eukprot:1335572-Pleurochrysis_carterae.AAC.1